MERFQLSIAVNRPAQEIFDFLLKPDNYLMWLSGVTEINAPNGYGKGSVVGFTHGRLDRQIKQTVRITENNGKDCLRMESTAGPVGLTSLYTLEPLGAKRTLFMIEYEIDAGKMMAMAEPAIRAATETRYNNDLKRLKEVLEKD